MDALDWWPKPLGPGDTIGDSARKLLGKPDLDPVDVLVREVAQNSWDARIEGGPPPSFGIHARTLSGDAYNTLMDVVLGAGGKGADFDRLRSQSSVDVIEIFDRGTSGLGGPLRNDKVHDSEVTDYIDFVLNVGARRDKEYGGGTHGFGKTISYIMSSVFTVVILSRSQEEDGFETRLIASAFADDFAQDGNLFTGRQWWGRMIEGTEEFIGPATGAEATQISDLIFDRGFEKDETGTSLLVVAPNLPEAAGPGKELLELMKKCEDAMLWHLWPKLVAPPSETAPPMEMSLLLGGEPRAVPDPSSHPVLQHFVDSLQAVRATQSGRESSGDPFLQTHEIWSKSPKKQLGHLATKIGTRTSGSARSESINPLGPSVRHVATMRDAELIVTYLPMEGHVDDTIDLAGVFKCSQDVDDSFAAAEPPAHDKWEPEGMQDSKQKSHVNVALNRIHETWDAQFGTARESTPQNSLGGEGNLSAALADLVSGAGGHGPGVGDSGDTTRSARKKSALREVPQLSFSGSGNRWAKDEMVIQGHHFRLERPRDGFSVVCEALAGVEGGQSMATDSIQVLGFAAGHVDESDAPEVTIEGDRFDMTSESDHEWTVFVVSPPLAVDVDLSIEVS